MRTDRGLSLMEILGVTVVVGTIAALVVPLAAQVRGASAKASCLENSRELSLAATLYARDNDDRFFLFGYQAGPEYRTWWGDLQSGDPAKGFLYPYTKSGRIRGCPSAAGLPNLGPNPYTMGYGMNFRLFYGYPPERSGGGFRTLPLHQIERPAETIMFGDAARWDEGRNEAVSTPWLYGDSPTIHLDARHAGGVANVSWMDAHASSVHLALRDDETGASPDPIAPEALRRRGLGDLMKGEDGTFYYLPFKQIGK